MPFAACILQPDGYSVHPLVGQHQDLGLFGQQELVQHVQLELAEPAAERRVVRRRDLLVADHDHVVIQQRLVNGLETARRRPAA